MSQTRGRNAGYREKANNQRQPHHLAKPNFAGRAQSSSKAPAREPGPTASIIKTRSFQFLVNAVGAENIALGLESSLTRVAELMKGERFTPETAFHMETTLGLPHGFFDQHHPVLAPELITRLKSPLEFVRMNEEEEAEMQAATPSTNIQEQSLLASGSSEEAKMASKTTQGALSAVKTGQPKVATPPSSNASAKRAASGRNASRQVPEHHPRLSNDAATVERIRRANLHVLTSRNGSKVKLGVVVGLSGSNMAHRLHGKKRMDDAEANRFTERLGLPGGWLDTPRSEAEIPASVSLLLSPTSRARAPAQQQQPPAAATNDGAPSEPAAPLEAGRSQVHAADGDQALAVSASPLGEEDTAALGSQDAVERSSAELADRPVAERDGQLAAVVAAQNGAPPGLATSQVTAASPSSASSTSLHGLDGIAPIAEALLKTLAGKARTGRLDELKALELLQQAVLL